MMAALILLSILVVVGTALYLHDRKTHNDAVTEAPVVPEATCTDDSCLLHSACPSEQRLKHICSDDIVYFDDEELDQYRGRVAADYNDTEIEQFRDVLYTLRRDEIYQWQHSLGRRGIALPEPLRDELLMLAAEP